MARSQSPHIPQVRDVQDDEIFVALGTLLYHRRHQIGGDGKERVLSFGDAARKISDSCKRQTLHALEGFAEQIFGRKNEGQSIEQIAADARSTNVGWLPAEHISGFAALCGVRPSSVAIVQQLGQAAWRACSGKTDEERRDAANDFQILKHDVRSRFGGLIDDDATLAGTLFEPLQEDDEHIAGYLRRVLADAPFDGWLELIGAGAQAWPAPPPTSDHTRGWGSIRMPPVVRLYPYTRGFHEDQFAALTGRASGVTVLVDSLLDKKFPLHYGALWIIRDLIWRNTSLAYVSDAEPSEDTLPWTHAAAFLPVVLDATSLMHSSPHEELLVHGDWLARSLSQYLSESDISLVASELSRWRGKASRIERLARRPLLVVLHNLTSACLEPGHAFRDWLSAYSQQFDGHRCAVLADTSCAVDQLAGAFPSAKIVGVGGYHVDSTIGVLQDPASTEHTFTLSELRRPETVGLYYVAPVHVASSRPEMTPPGEDKNYPMITVLVENSTTGRVLSRLADREMATPPLKQRWKLQRLNVVTAPYEFITGWMEDACDGKPVDKRIDIVIVNHISIFHEAVKKVVIKPFRLSDYLMTVARRDFPHLSTLFDWQVGQPVHGMPFHFPTKIIAYRPSHFRHHAASPEASRMPWPATELLDTTGRLGLALQAPESDDSVAPSASLYYEFLSWTQLLGGDIGRFLTDGSAREDTVRAIARFLKLFHPDGARRPDGTRRVLYRDWYSIVESLTEPTKGRADISMCLPFTDMVGDIVDNLEPVQEGPAWMRTLDELEGQARGTVGTAATEQGADLSFSPFWSFDPSQPIEARSRSQRSGEPRLPFTPSHPFTCHTVACMTPHGVQCATAFLEWWYDEDVQREFAQRTLEAPVLPGLREKILRQSSPDSRSLREQALRAACYAQAYLRTDDRLVVGCSKPVWKFGLNDAQAVIAQEVSDLLQERPQDSDDEWQASVERWLRRLEQRDELVELRVTRHLR